MTPLELSDGVTRVVENLRVRIEGVGAAQYDEGAKQRIEGYSHARLVRESLEEVEDILVYLAVLHTRLSALRDRVGDALD
jgi:hypothetical protein